jgi:hypothetical protein
MGALREKSDKQAWTVAAFMRTKKLPTYESLGPKEKKSMKSLKDALGASVQRKKKNG